MTTQRILGLDPGLQHTGWGVVDVAGTRLSFVACGVISAPTKQPMALRLEHIFTHLQALIAEFNPTHAAVEEVFVNDNPRTSLALGQARGLCLLVPALAQVPVAELTSTAVKQALVGHGRAEKAQVAHMVKVLLPLAVLPARADATDALAVAIAAAHHRVWVTEAVIHP